MVLAQGVLFFLGLRRQPVRTDAVSYTRLVMKNAVAEDADDGEH